MSKQIDFDFRVYPVGGDGYNHQQLSDEIRTQYLEKGWDVIKTEIAQVSANEIRLAVTFVKNQEVASVVPADSASIDINQAVDAFKRGPGRPKKDEGVPA